MTTPTPVSTPRPTDPAPDATANTTARTRQVVAGVCLLAAPVAFAAEILAPDSDGSSTQMLSSFAAQRTAGLLAAMLSLVAVLLFLPGVFGMLNPITGRGRRWGHAAAAAIIYGLVTAHAALAGINLMFYAMTDPSLDPSHMVRLMDVLTSTPAAIPLLLGHPVFAIGILALGVAVIRSRTYPRWTGVALLLWIAVDILAGLLPVSHIVGDLASNIFGVAALATIGWTLLVNRPPASDHGAGAGTGTPTNAPAGNRR